MEKKFKEHLARGDVEGVIDDLKHFSVNSIIDTKAKWTPIHYACWYGYPELVDILITQNCNIECMDKMGRRPIHFACQYGHFEIVESLIDRGCDINSKTNYNKAPIHYACHYGHTEIVNLLIIKNCFIEIQTGDKEGPIHLACREGHIDIVKILIEHGCYIDKINGRKKTPSDVAECCWFYEIVDLIKVTEEIRQSIKTNDGGRFLQVYSPKMLVNKNCTAGLSWLEKAFKDKAIDVIESFIDSPIQEQEVRYTKYVVDRHPTSKKSHLWHLFLLFKSIKDHHNDAFQYLINRPESINNHSWKQNLKIVGIDEVLIKTGGPVNLFNLLFSWDQQAFNKNQGEIFKIVKVFTKLQPDFEYETNGLDWKKLFHNCRIIPIGDSFQFKMDQVRRDEI